MENAAGIAPPVSVVPDRGAARRIRAALEKLRWGIRVVGLRPMAAGTLRLAALHLARPKRAEVRLRCGPVLEFEFPSQFPPTLVMFGDLIDPEFALLKEISRPGWVFVDAGAAIGQFAMFAASLPGSRVHAFEPSGANVATLRRNAGRNGAADRVDIHQLALSNTEGEARFQTAARTWMSRLDVGDATGGELVPVRRLNDAMAGLGLRQIDVLKVNVAGYEPEVLAGAMDFLAEGRADVLIMLLGLRSLPWYERIARLGYRFFYYHPGERALFEVDRFDAASVLNFRPWPARHIIAIRAAAIDEGLVASLALRRLTTRAKA